jgi:DNA replication and repair protein RecF
LQRNALLKNSSAKAEDFYVWDEKLSEYGERLIQKRLKFIEKVDIISRKIHKDITNEKESLEIIYKPSVFSGEETREVFFMKLKENLRKDAAKGNTETGPHKDDLMILVNGTDIRRFGSQGQQRTAALSLKLAELRVIKEETGEEAVLLLDDVLSELDAERQKYLIKSLKDVQLFITATEISGSVMESLPVGCTFNIKNGKASKI